MPPKRTQRVKLESLRKRRINYMRRGNEFWTRYGVNVYVCIQKKGQYYVYNSSPNDPAWPPSNDVLVRISSTN
jgi:hypothetical protein